MEDIVRALAQEIALLRGEVAVLRHRQANMFRPGTVSEVKAGEYRARVKLSDASGEDFLSPWRPWSAIAGASAQDWTVPEAGQQVLLFSPTGVLGQSLILPFGFSDDLPPPSASADERVFRFGATRITFSGDGLAYDAGAHTLKGIVRTDGETRLGKPDAAKRVLLEDFTPAQNVYGF
ncbi:phage baseplate assembly protein V [Xanthobacter tagetidis]|uniref:Phage baseplate assembly protein V n=1 Tax=Xanthobacter tagetidis TaxID=60216 RepID=A0A3L7AJ84_9HYPH|nr:phage baseplate assembly protein V [Xanthobacter tagetidis]MBB6308912.1 phage baseplate assembly protein V [Xanthobacter tagetidis]RLP80576.1 phage baseplate assembly protein V [Xanthobacter tagetidis]